MRSSCEPTRSIAHVMRSSSFSMRTERASSLATSPRTETKPSSPVTGGGRYWVGGGRYWVGGGRYPVFSSTSVLLTLRAVSLIGVKKVVTRRTVRGCIFLAARAFAVR